MGGLVEWKNNATKQSQALMSEWYNMAE